MGCGRLVEPACCRRVNYDGRAGAACVQVTWGPVSLLPTSKGRQVSLYLAR